MTYDCVELFTFDSAPGEQAGERRCSGFVWRAAHRVFLGGVLVVSAAIRCSTRHFLLRGVRNRSASVLVLACAVVPAIPLPSLAAIEKPAVQTHAETGRHHTIHLTWHAPAHSRDPVAGYNVYRSSDGGKSFSKLNSSPIAKPAYDDVRIRPGTTYLYFVKSVDRKGAESKASNNIRLVVP